MASSRTPEQRQASEAKKALRDRDAGLAMREYQAEAARIDANTARLRALRLAKEAAEAQAPVEPAAEKKTATRTAKTARRSPARSRT